MNLVGMLGKMVLSNAMGGRSGGGNLLGSLLGGAQGGGAGGGLGGLLGGAAGGAGGGLGGLLGGLTGGGQQGGAQQGGAGGMLGQIMGGGAQGGAGAGGLGGLLGQAMGQAQGQAPAQQPQQAENDQAALMIRAMVNSAKADGQIDEQEQQNIVGKLGGDIGPEEAEFIRNEMAAPLDVQGFIKSIPRGMEQQVYLISLMAINLDSKPEAEYLDQLAKGLNISEQDSNALHAEVGAPALYS